MEQNEIPIALCPHCGHSILEKILSLQKHHTEETKKFFESMKRLSSGDSPLLRLNEHEQKDSDSYFAGTKLSEKRVRCNSCHQDTTVSVNDLTGAVSGFDTETKESYPFRMRLVSTARPKPVVTKTTKVVIAKQEEQILIAPVPLIIHPHQQVVQIDEEKLLYIERYPGVPTFASR